MTNDNNKTALSSQSKEERISKALQTILDLPIALSCDGAEPRIKLPCTPDGATWRLAHPRVGDWIASTLWQIEKVVLLPGEIAQILRVLKGLAWDKTKSDDLMLAIDDDPLVQAILEVMEPHETKTWRMLELLTLLNNVAKSRHISTAIKLWPKTAAILSWRIKQIQPFLRQCNFEVNCGRNRDGAYVDFRRRGTSPMRDAHQPSASPGASSVDVNVGNTLGSCDAGDASTIASIIATRHPQLFQAKGRNE